MIPCLDVLAKAGAVGLACLAAIAGEGTPVREKIQFSGTGDAAVPATRPKDDPSSKSLEFLGRSSSSGAVGPALGPIAVPSYLPSSRFQEMLEQRLDQKRNWIFRAPADFGSATTAEEVFNRGAFGDTEKKPKTALERFLAGGGSKSAKGRTDQTGTDQEKNSLDKPTSRFDRDDRDRDDIASPLTSPYDSTRILSAGFSFANDFLGLSPAPPRGNEFLSTGTGTSTLDPVAKARDDRKHADEFRKLLNFSNPANPLTTGLAPVHLGLDSAPQELNLVTAPRLGELPGISREVANPLRAVSGPPGSRPVGLSDQTSRVLGPSSLAPAVNAPSAAPVRQLGPTIADFPKRGF